MHPWAQFSTRSLTSCLIFSWSHPSKIVCSTHTHTSTQVIGCAYVWFSEYSSECRRILEIAGSTTNCMNPKMKGGRDALDMVQSQRWVLRWPWGASGNAHGGAIAIVPPTASFGWYHKMYKYLDAAAAPTAYADARSKCIELYLSANHSPRQTYLSQSQSTSRVHLLAFLPRWAHGICCLDPTNLWKMPWALRDGLGAWRRDVCGCAHGMMLNVYYVRCSCAHFLSLYIMRSWLQGKRGAR